MPEDKQKAIVVMVKAPSSSQAKTRLIGPLSAAKVTSLYTAFVKDIVDKAQSVPGSDLLISFTPAGGKEEVRKLIGGATDYFLQEGSDLGLRMSSAFSQGFASGYEKVVLIGTDLPSLPRYFLEESFQLLDDSDIVLGPSVDGGYYLIGMKRHLPEVFWDIEWSTPSVLAQTMERVKTLGLSARLLKPWYDIDTPEDLDRLKRDLKEMMATESKGLPRYTVAELFGELG